MIKNLLNKQKTNLQKCDFFGHTMELVTGLIRRK